MHVDTPSGDEPSEPSQSSLEPPPDAELNDELSDLIAAGFQITPSSLSSVDDATLQTVWDALLSDGEKQHPNTTLNIISWQFVQFRGELLGIKPLCNLTSILVIHLNDNLLTGPIPNELYSLTNLTELDLSNNLLTDSLSPEIRQLTSLNELSLQNNRFGGKVPRTLADLSLHTLRLWSNNFVQIHPGLGSLGYISEDAAFVIPFGTISGDPLRDFLLQLQNNDNYHNP